MRFSGSGFGNDLRIMGSMIHLFKCTLNPVGRRNKKTSLSVRSIRSGDATRKHRSENRPLSATAMIGQQASLRRKGALGNRGDHERANGDRTQVADLQHFGGNLSRGISRFDFVDAAAIPCRREAVSFVRQIQYPARSLINNEYAMNRPNDCATLGGAPRLKKSVMTG